MPEFEKEAIFRLASSIEYQNKAIVSKQVLKKKYGQVTLFAFDRGEALSEHTSPYDAMVSLVEGKAEITINGKPYVLNSHDCIIMPANIPHAVRALEKFKMLLIMLKN